MFTSIFSTTTLTVNAVSNPYPTSQTVGGVYTIPCTYYAWQQVYNNTGKVLPAWGNAINWYNNAANAGYSVGSTPRANSIAVWEISGHSYGHVAYVTSVSGSGMTVNEGGRTDSTNTQGIVNGQFISATSVGSWWYGRRLVGFIYLYSTTHNHSFNKFVYYWKAHPHYNCYQCSCGEIKENKNETNFVASCPDCTSVTWDAFNSKHWVGSNNAVLARICRLNVDSSAVSRVGMYLYNQNGTLLKSKTENIKFSGNKYVEIWYDVKSELGYTLLPGIKYQYKYMAVVNGKTFYSPVYSFTTTGTHTHAYNNSCDTSCNTCGAKRTIKHTYSNSCDTTCNVCNVTRTIKHTYSNNCDTKCNVCGAARKVGAHKYTNNCDTTCNICSAKRSVNHNYKTTTNKATIIVNGTVVKKCSVCGKIYSSSIIYYPKTIKLSSTSYTYNGKTKTPSVTVKDSNGKTLKKNTDYTVSYASGRKYVGKYKVTVKFKGNYSGSKNLYFNINFAKISTPKVTKSGSKVKITWKNISGESGYQISQSTSKSKTKIVSTYKTTKGKSKTIKATRGRTYYYKVRAYKTVNGKKIYGAWSSVKSYKLK